VIKRGFSVQPRLVELVITLSVTLSPKPFRDMTVIVEFPKEPAVRLNTEGFAVMLKSGPVELGATTMTCSSDVTT